MIPTRTTLASLASLATIAALTFASSAKADAPTYPRDVPSPVPSATPLAVRHVVVAVEGTSDAVLEERPAGSDDWVTVCTLPCEATVIANPAAEHRIADGDAQRIVRITGTEGERVVVRYERGAKGARIGFIVGGGVVGGVGVIVLGLGLLRALSTVNGIGGEQCNASCRAEYDQGGTVALVAVGGVMALAGTLGVLHGVAIGKSTATTSNRPSSDDAPAPSEREPHWRSAGVAPSSPALHVPLLDARF
jgi:hypothetical protein